MFRELRALAGQIVQPSEQSGFAADKEQFESVGSATVLGGPVIQPR